MRLKKLLRLKYNIILDLSPQSQDQVSVYVYILSDRACASSCVNVCFHAGLPRSLVYPVGLCVSMLDSHRACISSSCVNAGPPQSLYILLCECMFPCWTPTVACISCVIVCFHAGLPRSL